MARPSVHIVLLSDSDREHLRSVVRQGRGSARELRRAHTLLLAEEGRPNETIAQMFHVCPNTVVATKKRYLAEGLSAALKESPRPGAERKLDGRQEAHLVALACSQPPEGHATWSLRLLADRLVELEIVDDISYETVRQALKKTRSNRG